MSKRYYGVCFMVSERTRLYLEGITDADWVGSVDDRKITSGVVFFL